MDRSCPHAVAGYNRPPFEETVHSMLVLQPARKRRQASQGRIGLAITNNIGPLRNEALLAKDGEELLVQGAGEPLRHLADRIEALHIRFAVRVQVQELEVAHGLGDPVGKAIANSISRGLSGAGAASAGPIHFDPGTSD